MEVATMLVEILITSLLGNNLRFGEGSLGFVSRGENPGVGEFWCLPYVCLAR
jgi:hypothetical protein